MAKLFIKVEEKQETVFFASDATAGWAAWATKCCAEFAQVLFGANDGVHGTAAETVMLGEHGHVAHAAYGTLDPSA